MRQLLIGILAIIMMSCGGGESQEKQSGNGEIFKGNHELRRFKVKTEKGERWHRSYFLIAGSASGETYQNTNISFSWKMNTGEYAISEIDLARVRIKIDSTVKTPYVKFHWDRGDGKNLEYEMKYNINYMVIVCREEDYPIEINLSEL